ncbi:uncharacterized protein [Nicotiana tomentosiformis]|uniref:uncharacterized protein n=1 Tax=Nicotiana tomentosiformis TaxID=4098 RepID=UPI00388CB6AE
MVRECLDYARRCNAFQFHANFIHHPPELLHSTVASCLFDAWGLEEVKKENVANFIQGNIIYFFGIPHYIITYNGNPFDNRLMNTICDLFGFKQHNASMYNVAANGLAETFNKTLCSLLKKVIYKSKRD